MRLRSWRAAIGFVVVVLVLAGCAKPDAPQEFLTPSGPAAETVDHLWNLVFWIAVFVFVVVEGLLLLVVLRFRARHNDTELPRQVEGNTRLEVLWTIIPALILAGIAVPTVSTIFQLTAVPDDALEIRVVGKQYWWEFQYPDEAHNVITAGEMYIPVGRPIHVVMESFGQADGDPQGVIHSFWVPKLAGKQDVVPGHQRTLVLSADEPGKYSGQCAEFCGLSHANMRFAVVAVPQEEFEAWAERHAAGVDGVPAEAAEGYELFETARCIGCHAINGYKGSKGQPAEAQIGPNLTFFNERDRFAGYTFDNHGDEGDENLRAWLHDPPGVKPGAQMPNLNLTDQQIDALVAYLRTLGEPREAE